jgi:hypothetical protein
MNILNSFNSHLTGNPFNYCAGINNLVVFNRVL